AIAKDFVRRGGEHPPSPARASGRGLDKLTPTKFRTRTCYPIAGYDAPWRQRLSQNTNGVLAMKAATRAAGSPSITSDEERCKLVTGGLAKRSFDITAAALALILFSPIFLMIMALIKCTDGGSAFYGHRRVGHNGRYFHCLKF